MITNARQQLREGKAGVIVMPGAYLYGLGGVGFLNHETCPWIARESPLWATSSRCDYQEKPETEIRR